MKNSATEWEQERVQALHKCENVKDATLKSFSRFINFSGPIQMCLSSEVMATKAMTALADLQGLVGEWSALRSVASEIQVV